MTILYPVAANAQAALASPLGRAAREREARGVAGEAVAFVTEEVGALYATREAALDAYRGRLDDERTASKVQVAPEDRYLSLRAVVEGPAPAPPLQPSFAEGRRWPKPPAAPRSGFRLLVSYWRIGKAPAQAPKDQARTARRRQGAAPLSADEVRALARQPLRPVRPQQPLDIGLFEAPAPEAPHILIPDD